MTEPSEYAEQFFEVAGKRFPIGGDTFDWDVALAEALEFAHSKGVSQVTLMSRDPDTGHLGCLQPDGEWREVDG